MADDSISKIRDLLKTFETAMLVTHGDESLFHARPMAIANVEDSCDLWFFTGRSSAKVREIENDQRVLVVCQEGMRYVVVRAAAKLILDRNRAREMWKPTYETWFPKGVNDPELMLIRAAALEAEYWDTSGLKSVRYLFEAAKAYMKGDRPHIREGEQHGTVTFSE